MAGCNDFACEKPHCNDCDRHIGYAYGRLRALFYHNESGNPICDPCGAKRIEEAERRRRERPHHCGHRYDDHGKHGCRLCHCAFVPIRELAR